MLALIIVNYGTGNIRCVCCGGGPNVHKDVHVRAAMESRGREVNGGNFSEN